MTKPRIIIW